MRDARKDLSVGRQKLTDSGCYVECTRPVAAGTRQLLPPNITNRYGQQTRRVSELARISTLYIIHFGPTSVASHEDCLHSTRHEKFKQTLGWLPSTATGDDSCEPHVFHCSRSTSLLAPCFLGRVHCVHFRHYSGLLSHKDRKSWDHGKVSGARIRVYSWCFRSIIRVLPLVRVEKSH